MPINSAYRVNIIFTSSTFWEFVSARIMNLNFKTAKYTADWKKKVISRKGAKKKKSSKLPQKSVPNETL